jgi:DNA-binding CsgD family transcriptional regulator
MVTRVNYAETYQDTCNIILQQIRTLIPIRAGIVFKSSREGGVPRLSNPVSTELVDDRSDHIFFTEGNYPHWDEFILSPYSMVYRQSDIIPPEKWEKTRVYREVWKPKNHFWGLFISLIRKDSPLTVIGLFREKAAEDFSSRDIYVLNTLKDPFERKFYALFDNQAKSGGDAAQPEKIVKQAATYGLTKRESEIVILACSGKSSDEMCAELFITHATLSKHLSNIYSKTKIRNRAQLFALFVSS